MNILLTGAAGFIGYHLSNYLLKNNSNVTITGIDNLNTYYDVSLKNNRIDLLKRNLNFTFKNIDISDAKQLEILKNNKYDLIINLAAQAGVRVDESKHHHYVNSNILGFLNIIRFADSCDIKKIIYASSSSVYSGIQNKSTFSEDLTLGTPNSFYAISKLTNEMQARTYSERLGISFIGLRFFTVYGDYGRPDMAYFSFSDSIRNNKEIILFNDGNMSRDMTHVDDIVEGINSAIQYILNSEELINEVFNLGNDSPVMTKYLLELVSNKLGINPAVISKESKNEVLHTHADLSKSFSKLGYKPKIKVEEGIEMFMEWYKIYFNFDL